MEENRRAGLKYFLFIGIPVIIVLVVLGAYYYVTNPMTVLTRTINTVGEKLEKAIDNTYKINLEEKPWSMTGNLEFQTNIEGLKEFQEFNYDFQFDMDYTQKYFNLGIGLNKEEEKIIYASIYQVDNQKLIESKELFETPIDITSLVTTNFEITKKGNWNKNDIKEIIQKWKNYFLDTLDNTYLSREKKDITINNQTVKTTKITYLFNEANQKRTINMVYEKVINDDDLLEKMANITNQEKEVLKESLKMQKDDFEYTRDSTIEVYTEGLKQNVIKVVFKDDKESIITYENFKNKMDINIMNEFELTDIIITEKKLEANYNIINKNITGNLKMESEKKDNIYEYKISISSNSKNENIEVNLDLSLEEKSSIKIPDISNAQAYENLSGEDILKIFENLENTFKETNFYQLMEENIM